MFFIKCMRAIQLSSEFGITFGKGIAGSSPYGVSGLIAEYRSQRGKYQQPCDIQFSRGGKYSGGDQKGIAREEKSEEKAGFHKNNCRDADDSAPLYQLANVHELS
jgi:hypothetical protein